jgi:hypothetical protein
MPLEHVPEPKLHRIAENSMLDVSGAQMRRNRQSVWTRSDNGNVRTVHSSSRGTPSIPVGCCTLADESEETTRFRGWLMLIDESSWIVYISNGVDPLDI